MYRLGSKKRKIDLRAPPAALPVAGGYERNSSISRVTCSG
jgi:hypothetical protein